MCGRWSRLSGSRSLQVQINQKRSVPMKTVVQDEMSLTTEAEQDRIHCTWNYYIILLEKIFNKRLMSFIKNHHVLTDGQYGFRSNHSTSLALTEFVEKVTSAIDKQESTIGVFIDLKKAFDTVDHKILLSKLQCYGIRGLALDWIKSYLANRSQYVCYNNSNSELKNIKCGVQQESIMVPVLFILYINDMCEVSKLLNIILFADDTSIFYSTRNIVDITCTVNNELEKLDIWFRVNKLSLNVNKTNFIMFTNKKTT